MNHIILKELMKNERILGVFIGAGAMFLLGSISIIFYLIFFNA